MNGEVKVLDAAMVKASKPPSAKPVEPDHPPEVVKDEKGKKGKVGLQLVAGGLCVHHTSS